VESVVGEIAEKLVDIKQNKIIIFSNYLDIYVFLL
jgi:hypothetical protein